MRFLVVFILTFFVVSSYSYAAELWGINFPDLNVSGKKKVNEDQGQEFPDVNYINSSSQRAVKRVTQDIDPVTNNIQPVEKELLNLDQFRAQVRNRNFVETPSRPQNSLNPDSYDFDTTEANDPYLTANQIPSFVVNSNSTNPNNVSRYSAPTAPVVPVRPEAPSRPSIERRSFSESTNRQTGVRKPAFFENRR